MLISIIIPTYNCEKTLRETLTSINDQYFKDFEILVIDGLSVDQTLGIAKEYQSRVDLTIISEKDDGIYDAMNKGIKIARGEWLYFLGSDDYLFNNYSLIEFAKHLNDDNDIVYGNSIWIPRNFHDTGSKGMLDLLQNGINHQRIFYRKDIFFKYGLYDVRYKIAADYALNIIFFCNPEIIKKYVNVDIAYYYDGGISSQVLDINLWDDWRSVIVKPFKGLLPAKDIYQRLYWYCWYNLNQKKYFSALKLFIAIFLNTLSFTFLKHTFSQLLKHFRKEINK